MRKLTALLLAGGLLLTLSGCKKNSSQESSAPEPTPATEQYSEYTQPPATRRLTTAAVLPQPDTTEPTTASAAPSTYTEPELTQSQETVTTEGKIDKNGVYTAECKTDSPQTLILSAAYDEGFSAEINGEPAPVFRVNSCQLAVEIPAGESRVVLRYHVPGLLTGLLLGGGTLLAAVLLYLLRRKIPKKMLRAGSRIAAPALQAAYVLLLLVIYIFPLVSWAAAMLVRLVTPKTGVL